MAEENNEKKKPSSPRKRTPKKNMSLLPDEGQMLQYSLFDTKQKINESTNFTDKRLFVRSLRIADAFFKSRKTILIRSMAHWYFDFPISFLIFD